MSIHDHLDTGLASVIFSLLDPNKSAEELHDEIQTISDNFEAKKIWDERYLTEIRVEILHSLLTIDALKSDFSRRDLARYFERGCGVDSRESKQLADRIFRMFRLWETRRKHLATKEDFLWRKQNGICNHCHHKLIRNIDEIVPVIHDMFRPFFWDEYRNELKAHVDHIQPISFFGDNQNVNLQLLCMACNLGKKQGLLSNYFSSLKNSSAEFGNQKKPTKELFKLIRPLVYYRIKIDENACTTCGSKDKPLTIRTLRVEVFPTISNTRTFCYDCI